MRQLMAARIAAVAEISQLTEALRKHQ